MGSVLHGDTGVGLADLIAHCYQHLNGHKRLAPMLKPMMLVCMLLACVSAGTCVRDHECACESYSLLGTFPEADEAVIKTAYRKQAKYANQLSQCKRRA